MKFIETTSWSFSLESKYVLCCAFVSNLTREEASFRFHFSLIYWNSLGSETIRSGIANKKNFWRYNFRKNLGNYPTHVYFFITFAKMCWIFTEALDSSKMFQRHTL